MHLLYNSDNFTVVQFDLPAAGSDPAAPLRRGGYEIVDKFARKEIWLEGALAERFERGVQELASGSPGVEDFDDYLAHFTALAQQPLRLH